MDGKLLFFPALFSKAEQKPFPGRIIVFDLQVHDGADPGEGIGQGTKESAITEANVREDIDRVKQRLDLASDERRRFALNP
jgi:hypothetical protein